MNEPTFEDEEIFPGQKDGISAMSGDNYVSTYEPTFEDEEVTFTFEGKDYSAMVDFYDQDEWKVFTLAVWDTKTDEWNVFNGKERSSISEGLTKVLDREIEQRGDNLFEEAYHGRLEATDWKDCYD